MSHVLTIAGRELVEKRFVFLAAIAFAIVAVVIPFVPGVHSTPRDTIAVASLVLATAFVIGLSAVLGTSFIGRDITTGRMSFYFARPVSGASIWFGKLGAEILLIVSSFVIVLIPAMIAGPLAHWLWTDTRTMLLIIASIAASLFFLTHAIGTMVRSRSPLIAVDFAAAVISIAAIWTIAVPLIQHGAIEALTALSKGMGIAKLLVVVLAGAWQLADGRSDRRRSHAAFSKALWSGVAVILLLAAGFVAWLGSASLRNLDFRSLYIEQAPSGGRALVSGLAPHRFDFRPTFVVDARNGNATSAPGGVLFGGFSPDGTRLIGFSRLRPFSASSTIIVRDIRSGRDSDTRFAVNPFETIVVPNGDASRLAIFHRDLLTVYDVASDRVLATARMPMPRSLFFASPDVVRAYVFTKVPPRLSAYELDAARRTLTKSGEIDVQPYTMIGVNRKGTEAVLSVRGPKTIVDARTLQTIAPFNGVVGSMGKYLSDGRIVYIVRNGDQAELRVRGTDGSEKVIGLGSGRSAGVMGELAPGIVLCELTAQDRLTAISLDVDRGAVVQRIEGVAPPQGWRWDLRPSIAGPDILVRTENALVRWNALTGETKTLIGG